LPPTVRGITATFGRMRVLSVFEGRPAVRDG
jgi:hypothetical protein